MSQQSARIALLVLCAALFPFSVRAAHNTVPATDIIIDLAAQQEGSTVVLPLPIRDEGPVAVLLVNTVPRGVYDVAMQIDLVGSVPITIDRSTAGAFAEGASTISNFYGTALRRLDTAREETSLPALRQAVMSQLSIAGGDRLLADSVLRRTSYRVPGSVALRPGERLLVLVRRRSMSGEREKTWTSIFTTGARGHWLVSLGFGFPILLNRENEYFTVSDSASRYVIHRKQNNQAIKVIPAVFFHWLPRGGEGLDWSWSVMGGLGYDMRNAVVFLGLSITYNENITIAAGGVAHRLRQLNGKYSEGGVIMEDLDDDQLHEEVYRINPFVGVSFRFGDNMFAGK